MGGVVDMPGLISKRSPDDLEYVEIGRDPRIAFVSCSTSHQSAEIFSTGGERSRLPGPPTPPRDLSRVWLRGSGVILATLGAFLALLVPAEAAGITAPATEQARQKTPEVPWVEDVESVVPRCQTTRPRPHEAGARMRLPLPPVEPPTRADLSIQLGGRDFAYTMIASHLPIADMTGDYAAQVFFVAYLAKRDRSPSTAPRAITFVFNGGPGAASAYLNIGGIGPRVLLLASDGAVPSISMPLVDNPDSWLDFTDLVFIDAVGTGFSIAVDPGHRTRPVSTRGSHNVGRIGVGRTRAPGGCDPADMAFWGIRQDVHAMAAFMASFLAEYGLQTAPVHLVGESYGGFRVPLLIEYLRNAQIAQVSGAVLVSPLLDFHLRIENPHDPLPAALRLAAFAGAEMMRTGTLSQDGIDAIQSFALNRYLGFLALLPPPGEREGLFERLSTLTGVPVSRLVDARGRISVEDFLSNMEERHGGQPLSYDATAIRLFADEHAAESEGRFNNYAAMSGLFGAAMTRHLQETCGTGRHRNTVTRMMTYSSTGIGRVESTAPSMTLNHSKLSNGRSAKILISRF